MLPNRVINKESLKKVCFMVSCLMYYDFMRLLIYIYNKNFLFYRYFVF